MSNDVRAGITWFTIFLLVATFTIIKWRRSKVSWLYLIPVIVLDFSLIVLVYDHNLKAFLALVILDFITALQVVLVLRCRAWSGPYALIVSIYFGLIGELAHMNNGGGDEAELLFYWIFAYVSWWLILSTLLYYFYPALNRYWIILLAIFSTIFSYVSPVYDNEVKAIAPKAERYFSGIICVWPDIYPSPTYDYVCRGIIDPGG